MTMRWRGLLVSVRNATEAAAALAGGAAIIDVKEPRRGALGRADPEASAAVARVVGMRRPWTMACGELNADRKAIADDASEAISSHLARTSSLLADGAVPPAAVKIGLAGMAGTPWQRRLGILFASLPPGCGRVAVAYADWQRAGAPAPEDVIAAAAHTCSALLIDTFDKAAGSIFDCCPPGMPEMWVAAAHAVHLQVAVAGRIRLEEIPAAWALGSDVVALRSAVCFNGRDGAVQAELVERAVRLSGRHDPATFDQHP